MTGDEPRFTLAEARQELLRQECRHYGHTWEIHSTLTGPTFLACRCGESVNVMTAERVRAARAEAWDEGVREGKRLGEWGLPGLSNPYRETP